MSHWIKMRKDLRGDPAVILLRAQLGLTSRETIGLLHEFWSWADSNVVDGEAQGLTPELLDLMMEAPGFSVAMEKVRWLTTTPTGISIPNFERHLGNGAKRRSLTAARAGACRLRRQQQRASQAPGAADHALVNEIARHLNFGYTKASQVVRSLGITAEDWQSWREYERRHGTALTAQNIQRYRRPAEVPVPVVVPRPMGSSEVLSRRSSFAEPGKFQSHE